MRSPLHPALILASALLAGGCFALGWDNYKEAPPGSGGGGGGSGGGGAGGDAGGPMFTTGAGAAGGQPDPLPGPPHPIATAEAAPRFVAVDGKYVYWSNQGEGAIRGIRQLSTETDEVITLALTNQRVPWQVAAREETVVWGELTESGDCAEMPDQDRVMTVDFNGATEPQVIWSGCGNPRAVAMDGDAVYWTLNVPGTVTHAHFPLPGAVEDIATGQPKALGIAIDDAAVIWANSDVGTIGRLDKATGAVATLAVNMGPTWPALDADAVYWITATEVARLPRNTPDPQLALLGQGYSDLQGIAVDDVFVYFTDAGAGRVLRVRKDGSAPPAAIAEGQGEPTGIAVDDEAVYWTNSGSGEIMRQEKP